MTSVSFARNALPVTDLSHNVRARHPSGNPSGHKTKPTRLRGKDLGSMRSL
jgi:hypothetical protein